MTSKFYVLFNSFSVTSGECAGGKERLCAIQPCLLLRDVPLRRGSNPGLLDQWTKATGVPLQNKPCKDGWVEEGGVPTCTIIRRISLIHHQLKTVFQNAKKDHFYLGYGAEKRRKVVSSRLGFAIRRLESSLCQPNSKSNQRRIRQQKEKDGLCLSSAVPKIAPMSLRL